jgi:hypothetical protein
MKTRTSRQPNPRAAALHLREQPVCELCLVDGEHSDAEAVLDPDDPLGMRSACPVHVGVPRDVLDALRSGKDESDGRPVIQQTDPRISSRAGRLPPSSDCGKC